MLSMKGIAVLNNYSLARVGEEVMEGHKPAHHLFGADALEKEGYRVIYVNPDESRTWRKIGKWLSGIPFLDFGDLGIQVEAFRRRKEYDLIYAPCQDVTIFLGVLSYFGLFNKRIFSIAHHPFLRGRMGALRKYSLYFSLKGHASCWALSTEVVNQINLIRRDNNAFCVSWGCDLQYYDSQLSKLPRNKQSTDLISIGRTGRDYETLVRAFNNTSVKVDIYASRESIPIGDCSANITFHILDTPEQLSYPGIIALYSEAKILAIPMFASRSLSGLTSITDGLAMGIPMLITKNPYIEIDIEKERAGYWIEVNDSNAWRDKALSLFGDPQKLEMMGRNGRALAEKKFNYQIFASEVIREIKKLEGAA